MTSAFSWQNSISLCLASFRILGAGGLRGATPCSRSGGATLFKVRKVAVLCWSSCEEIPHIQGKRNPSKMVGVARGHQRADTLKP